MKKKSFSSFLKLLLGARGLIFLLFQREDSLKKSNSFVEKCSLFKLFHLEWPARFFYRGRLSKKSFQNDCFDCQKSAQILNSLPEKEFLAKN